MSDTRAARREHSQTAEYLDAVPLSPQGRERLDRLIALGESRRSPFDGRPSKLTEAFRFESKPRSFALPVQRSHGRLVAMLAVFLIVVASVARLRTARQPAGGTGELGECDPARVGRSAHRHRCRRNGFDLECTEQRRPFGSHPCGSRYLRHAGSGRGGQRARPHAARGIRLRSLLGARPTARSSTSRGSPPSTTSPSGSTPMARWTIPARAGTATRARTSSISSTAPTRPETGW